MPAHEICRLSVRCASIQFYGSGPKRSKVDACYASCGPNGLNLFPATFTQNFTATRLLRLCCYSHSGIRPKCGYFAITALAQRLLSSFVEAGQGPNRSTFRPEIGPSPSSLPSPRARACPGQPPG